MEQQMDKGVGWLQKLLNLQNKYGFFSIVKGLFLILLSGYVIFFALNPKYLLERITKIQTEEHSDLIETRLKSDTENSALPEDGIPEQINLRSDRPGEAWGKLQLTAVAL